MGARLGVTPRYARAFLACIVCCVSCTESQKGLDGRDGVDGRDGLDGRDGSSGQDGMNGTDGRDGRTSLIRLDPEAAGPNCPVGGTAIHHGLDANDNGVLDPGEEISTTYYCGIAAPSVVNGSVSILNETDLAFLSSVTVITGDLRIEDANGLVDLSGLQSLQTVGGDVTIYRNDALVSLRGLEALTSVGGVLDVFENPVLEAVAAPLGALRSVVDLFIENNATLLIAETDALLASPSLVVAGDTFVGFNADPYEPNNVITDAFGVANGFGEPPFNLHPGDVDWFRVTVDSDRNGVLGDTVAMLFVFVFGEDVNDDGIPDGTPPRTVSGLFDSTGNLIMRNSDVVTSIQSTIEVPVVDGVYYVAVSGRGDDGFEGFHDASGVYELRMSSITSVPTGSISGRILADSIFSPSVFFGLDQVPRAARFAQGEMLVRFSSTVTSEERSAVAADLDLEIVRPVGDAYLLRERGRVGRVGLSRDTVGGERTLSVLGELLSKPQIRSAQPNFQRQPTLVVPNDSRYGEQWSLANLNMEATWDITVGSASITIAVLDTGVLSGHEDLACGRLFGGYDFVDNDSTPQDTDPAAHGTHVLGTVGACSNQGVGIAGVDWSASLLPIRVLGSSGGFDSEIADGIYFAVNSPLSSVVNANPADVLNLSLGGPGESPDLQAAIDEANALGAVVVVAAGNDAIDAAGFSPANAQGVITVGAVGISGFRAGYSNFGTSVDVYGPGGDFFDQGYFRLGDAVLSLSSPALGDYRFLQGTSMASPHVAGIVSLMKTVHGGLNVYTVREYMQVGAAAVPGESARSVNAFAAVTAALAGEPLPGFVFPERTSVDLGTGNTLSLTLTNLGDDTTTYTIVSDDSGITTSPQNSTLLGGASESVQINLDRAGLDDGAYRARLTVTSSPSGEVAVVTVRYVEGTATNGFPNVTVWLERVDFGGKRYVYRRVFDLTRTAGHYDFTFSDLPDDTYDIVALIDQDGDGLADFMGSASGVAVAGGGMVTGADLAVSSL